MNEQGPLATNENKANRATGGKCESRDALTPQAEGDANADVIGQAKNIAGEVLEQARGAAGELIDQTKKAAAEKLTSAEDLAGRLPDIAGQMSDKAESIYHDGSDYLSQRVQAYPLAALLVAGAVGYGLGYLLSRR